MTSVNRSTKHSKKKYDDPLATLDQIEQNEENLTDNELDVINTIFNDLNEFNILQDNIKSALIKEKLEKQQLKNFFDSTIRQASIEVRSEKKVKRSLLFRFVFELPEVLRETLVRK